MIPAFVETVRGYMQHERGVLTDYQARLTAMKATTINDKISADKASTALGLKVSVEAYPD